MSDAAAPSALRRPRILLVGDYPPDRQISMQRYAEMLRDGLKARGFDLDLIQPPRVFGGGVEDGFIAKWLGYVDKYLLFPLRLNRVSRAFDRVHICDHSNAVYLPFVGPNASITCHDLIAVNAAMGRYPARKVGQSGRLLQRWILRSLRRAGRAVNVSAKTASDLRALGWSGEDVVIGNCLNYDFHRVSADEIARAKAKWGLAADQSYFIHVGGNQWYKNRIGVVNIYAELALREPFSAARLVMIGKPWSPALRKLVRDLGLEGRIIEGLGASSEDIRALYSGSTALLFPSLEEGFGWPVLEAQTCGCPVITSARSPMLEVAGEAAVFIDPEDPVAAANAIVEAAPRFGALATEGLRNARRFDRDLIMNQYADFLSGR